MNNTTLNTLEQAVLEKLLDGNHSLLNQLRDQLRICSVAKREMTGAGFYTYFNIPHIAGCDRSTVRFGDVQAQMEGLTYGAGFLLYVEGGRLDMLEGYSYEEPWPDRMGAFTVQYNGGSERDWASLEKDLSPP